MSTKQQTTTTRTKTTTTRTKTKTKTIIIIQKTNQTNNKMSVPMSESLSHILFFSSLTSSSLVYFGFLTLAHTDHTNSNEAVAFGNKMEHEFGRR
jgi:hypothetical protein